MSGRGVVVRAAVALMMAGTVAAVAPGSATGGTNWIKWFKSSNFATLSECVAEKNRYAVDFGLDVRPGGSSCFGAYYFEYAQEF
ncbi:MAG TPA: hypothetical protein VFV67_33710 [Actinophytocola sp.]|uniref:hypothetical protein n=1 Tax=Actinophytocola sp. TaxID=1872138 RepID=UPI002DBC3E18|nr:hypothetical protein [Actinophytocola sp.]HEU5475626.1 hypothetical protein [Actinophytocola sp.]